MRRRGLLPLIFIVVVAFGALTLTVVSDSSPQLGLDLQGGASVVLSPSGEVDSDSLDEAVEIIRNRVDALGVAEPVIARQGDNVVVELPGVDNQRRALELVGDTAELEFRPVCELLSPFGAEPPPAETTGTTAPADSSSTTATTGADGATATTTAGATDTTAAEQGLGLLGSEGELAGGGGTTTSAPGSADDTSTSVPEATTTTAPVTASTVVDGAVDPATATASGGGTPCPSGLGSGPNRNLCQEPQEESRSDGFIVLPECDEDGNEVLRYRVGPTALTGRSLSGASASLGGSTGNEWVVNPVFKSGENGIDKFNAVSALCYAGDASCPVSSPNSTAGLLAIALDNVVVSAPQIETPSFERDQITISGTFTESSAKDLATVLKYGSLPVELETQAVETVSPSLGEESLRAGLIAGLVGVAAVCIYMVLYYRALGLVVIAGLSVWGALNWAIICYLSATAGLALTLAGVTGIIVSVGVTVDSYVVYFERLKDDVQSGKSLRSSTGRSFNKAFKTILTADVSSFMGAAILYFLTVGPVRGFAFFLGLSTLLDVVVAYMFTRPAVGLLGRSRLFTEARFIGVARGMERRDPVLAGSAAATAARAKAIADEGGGA